MTRSDLYPGSGEGASGGEVLELSLSDIVENPEQLRREVDERGLAELAASIRERGVLQPITVTPKGTDGKHRVVRGTRRLQACSLAGRLSIPAIVRSGPPDTLDQLIENIQREALSHEDTARFVIARIESGISARELGRILGKTDSWISRYQHFFRLHEMIRARIDIIGMTTATAVQSALEENEAATRAFLASREAFTHREFEAFRAGLQASAATSAAASAVPSVATSASAVPCTCSAGAAASGNALAHGREPQYVAMVRHRKRRGLLGELLTDREPDLGDGFARVLFAGKISELAISELKIVALQPRDPTRYPGAGALIAH